MCYFMLTTPLSIGWLFLFFKPHYQTLEKNLTIMKMTSYKFILFLLCMSFFTPSKAHTNLSAIDIDPCDGISASFSLPATLCQNYGNYQLSANYPNSPTTQNFFYLDGNALVSMSPANPPSFNTNTLSLGNHTVTYTVTVIVPVIPPMGGAPVPVSCTKSTTKTVEIIRAGCPDPCDPIVPSFSLPATLCQNSGVFTLSGNYGANLADPIAAGSFTLDGVGIASPGPMTPPSFNTNTLTLGDHIITYTVQTRISPAISIPCTKSTTKTFKIVAPVTPTISYPSRLCVTSNGNYLDSYGSPAGGTFTVDGVPATIIVPRTLGVGPHTIVYTLPQACGTSSATKTVIFEDLTGSIDNLASYYCKSQTSSVGLTGTPAGGTFNIDGSFATSFNPSALTVGSHTVDYFLVSAVCTLVVSKTFEIVPQPPTPSITNLSNSYCRGSSFINLQGSPSGGIFTIDGVQNNLLFLDAYGVGTHTVTYTVKDNSGRCSSTTSSNFFIGNPTASGMIMGFKNSYCQGEGTSNLNGMPSGGTYTIDGVALQMPMLDPSVLSIGKHTIVYNPLNSCALPVTQTFEIVGSPTPLNMNALKAIYTVDEKPVTLKGSPAEAVFTIDGLKTSVLDPANLSVGDHMLLFSMDVGGCSNKLSHAFRIMANNAEIIDNTKCFTIVSKSVEKALSLEKPINYASIVLKDNTQQAGQKWQFEQIPNGYFKIKALQSGKYLMARTNGRTTSAYQIDYSIDGFKDWQVEKMGQTGYYRLVQRASGKALGVVDFKAQNPFNLGTWVGSDAQLFKIEPVNCANESLIENNDETSLLSQPLGNKAANFAAYPNPFTQELTVDFEVKNGENYQLMFTNTLGSRLFEKKEENVVASDSVSKGLRQVKISTADLPNGTYILTLKTGVAVFNYKLIKH
jgi:Secretion system C-terminal sorting domain